MLGRALAFAAEAHKEQKDKSGIAYFLHPVRIAETLRQNNWSEIHQTVGILHDTVEDTPVTLQEIHNLFGSLVGDAVDALTRRGHWEANPASGDPKWKWVWDEEYKKHYIPRCCRNQISRVVKEYDVYDNADPRRYVEGVPLGRYFWTLTYIQKLKEGGSVGAHGVELIP